MEFTEPVYRHPLDANSLLLRGTQGCSYNKCNFCYISREYRFAAASLEHMEKELQDCEGMYPPHTRIFLVGANPLALPARKLLDYATLIKKYYPQFREISMQGRVTDIARKSLDELIELRQAGMRHLLVGIESGNEEALLIMNKGHSASQTMEQLTRLKQAGIEFTTLYILGCAGRGQGEKSGLATASLLSQAGPRMISTTGLTAFTHAPIHQMVQSGQFVEASEKEKIEELKIFIENLECETQLYSMHYLNPIKLRVTLPQARQHILHELNMFLNSYSATQIEQMVNRQHMTTL